MSSLFRRTLDYVPRAQETTLSTQRQLQHAVAPYRTGGIQNWKTLSFLLNADTAELTQSLSVPSGLTDDQLNVLVDFIIRRGARPFEKLEITGGDLAKIEEKLEAKGHAGELEAYSYNVDSLGMTIKQFSFPDFTTDIRMSEGEILNIPSKIVRLQLFYVKISDANINALENTEYLKDLTIFSSIRGFKFRGLPQWLENFDVQGYFSFVDGYHYDCKHLRILRISSSLNYFPKEFVDSIVNSLIDLHVRVDDNSIGDLGTYLQRFTKLEILSVGFLGDNMFSLDLNTIQSRIVDFSYGGKCKPFNSSRPWIGLKKLTIAMSDDLLSILNGAPNLRELSLLDPTRRRGETQLELDIRTRSITKIPETSRFPSVKSLKVRDGYGSFITLQESKTIFPNLSSYFARTIMSEMIRADFDERRLWMFYAPNDFTSHEDFSYAKLDLDKFKFEVFDNRKTKGYNIAEFELPSGTKEIEIDFKGKTNTYTLDNIFDANSEERKRLFEALNLTIHLTETEMKVEIELRAKPTRITIQNSTL